MGGPPKNTPIDTRASALEAYRLGSSSFTGDSTRSVAAQSAQRALTYGNLASMQSNSFSISGDHIVIDDDGFNLPGATPGNVGNMIGYKRTNGINEDRFSTFKQDRFGTDGAGFLIEMESLRRVQLGKVMFEATSDLAQPSIEFSTRSAYSNTVDPQSVAQYHAETFALNQRSEQILSDQEQKLESRKRSHPYLYNAVNGISEAIEAGSGQEFGPIPGTGGFGEGSSSTGLRRADGTSITYLNGYQYDDGSYSGDGSEFYAPNLMPDGVTEYPIFVSDYLISPYNLIVSDYIYGFQYLYEDNEISSNNDMIFTADRKIFRNMYYDNTHTFLDHVVDFTRVMPAPFFDHLYDHPTAVYQPLDSMLEALKSSDDAIDLMHMTKMTAIINATSDATVLARSSDWAKIPEIFLYQKGAMYADFLKPYTDLSDEYKERIRVFDVNSIVPLSNPVTGLPWLNLAKAEYADVIGAKHGFHKRRDMPKIVKCILDIQTNTSETYEACVGTVLYTLVDATKILSDFKNILETRKSDEEALLTNATSSEQWVNKFVIQGIVVNLATLAFVKNIVDVAGSLITAATRLGQILTYLRNLLSPTRKLDDYDQDFVSRLEEIIERHKDKAETTPTDDGPPGGPVGGDEPTVPDGAGGDSTDSSIISEDPGTVATAMNQDQLQNYVNSGGMSRPYETLYGYELTLYDTFQSPEELGFPTYRSYIESRLDYNISDHGNLFKLDVGEQMPQTVFDDYISNGRSMPYYAFNPLPRIGTSPSTYRELIEDSADYDEASHRHLWDLPDPGTIQTAMTSEQYSYFVNNGGRVPVVPFYAYRLSFRSPLSLLGPSSFDTYRQYLESRSDYVFLLHGGLHKINIDERMSETVFDSYLVNGFMPLTTGPGGFLGVGPQIGTSPTTYREYLENCADYVEYTHRHLWYHDPSDITDSKWTAEGDPESIERMSSITGSYWLTALKASEYNPNGYTTYLDYMFSRTNYNTDLAGMYTEAEFNSNGMSLATHTYYMYVRNRQDYSTSINTMLTRSQYQTLVLDKATSSGISYELYRIERSDYDSLIHSWDEFDQLSMNSEVVSVTGENGWQSIKRLSATATLWYPDTTKSSRQFYDDVVNDNFDSHGSYTRAWPSGWNEICFTRSSADGTIDQFNHMTKGQMDLILAGSGWVNGTALRTQDGTSQSFVAFYNHSGYDLRAPMIHSGTGDGDRLVVYEEHYDATGSNSEGGVYLPKVSNKQYDVYVRTDST